ncbi:MAG: inositol monophosphatase [Phyllobacteriaceae bacterium]|nr:inositol monophosphatase [Phyllobacteriaceae bacterium]
MDFPSPTSHRTTLVTTPFSRSDLADLAAILAEAADREILPHFRRLADDDVSTKSGPLDLVTVADRAAERHIAERLADRFPGALVVGEEGCAADTTLLDRLASAERAIVVDPIDGTFNFAAGLPLFGVMAAVVIDGRTVAGVIHDPIGGDHLCALAGEGAWSVGRDGGSPRPLRVAPPAPVAAMHGPLSWPGLPSPDRERVAARQARLAMAYCLRCAAHEYRLIATGAAHLALYGKLMPWDHLAGALIHAEAGGHSARLDGSTYRPHHRDGGLLLAPDEASWHALHEALLGD